MNETGDLAAYRRRATAAIMDAIAQVSTIDKDGTRQGYVMVKEACQALMFVTASLLEGTAGCQSKRGMWEASEFMAKVLRSNIEEIRRVHAETGELPFDATHFK